MKTGMMKFVNSDTTTMSLRHGEQYENCSELLIEPDMTSLEELDPAILSCGLPAIVLNQEDLTTTTATTSTTASTKNALPSSLMASCSFNVAAASVIRYTVAHLLALRKSPFSHRRPAAIDDPPTAQYPIWSRTGFNHHQDRVRRVSGSDEELLLGGGGGGGGGSGAYGRKPNERQRDNGFNPPRFRRNHEFSNRNHHVIVKSYNASDPCGHNGATMRLQDTIIEEEPEWVVAGPTSRLDTIELRGFDDDVSRTVAESLKTSPVCGKQRGVFFDELLHYEHLHPKHGNKHDISGSAGDGESVSTNTGSPPPARSTPTKGGSDMNNNTGHGRKQSGMAAGCSSSGGGVNVSNFEELMKFDSILGDSGDSTTSSRFSKYYHRGTSGGTSSGSGSGLTGAAGTYYQHHNPQQHHVRFALDRNTHHYTNTQQHQHRQAGSGRLSMSALQHPPAGVESFFPSTGGSASTASPSAGDAKSFQRLLEMLAAQNQRNYQQHQQQYLLQLLQNCQETETLRQMLLNKCSLENATAAASANFAAGQPNQRMPTQAELQQHTQSIMKQALLRKKIAEQSRYLLEQQQQQNGQEPIPAVQQLIQSICPNVQRSLSALAGNGQQHIGADGRNDSGSAIGSNLYTGSNRGQMRPLNRRY